MGAARGRLLKQFGKVAGRWKGGGFSGEPDYGLVDCERSVIGADRKADALNGGYGGLADINAAGLKTRD